MKRIWKMTGLLMAGMLFFAASAQPCLAVARTETRRYDEGHSAPLILPITVTNVAWDNIQAIPTEKEPYCAFANVSGDRWDELYSGLELESDTPAPQFLRLRATNDSNHLYIGAAAPCTVTFEPGGHPELRKWRPAQEGEKALEEETLGGIPYVSEEVPADLSSGSVTLEPGIYFVNNYSDAALEALGVMYWYDYILTVQDPATITNADAGVKIIDSVTYTGDNFYESCSILTFPHQPPIIREGRTLVPMRAIFEALDATVDWDGEAQTITAAHGDTSVVMQIGSSTMTKNGEAVALDVPPELVNGTTLIPVRAVSEAFGLPVEWDAEYNLVVIRK